jgi:hypothetical protein
MGDAMADGWESMAERLLRLEEWVAERDELIQEMRTVILSMGAAASILQRDRPVYDS